MSARDAVTLAAVRELRQAADEGVEFILPPKAAGFLAEILAWTTGARTAVTLAAVRELRQAADEGVEFILPPKAAGFLAEILAWTTGARTELTLGQNADALAECLVIDDSERTS